MLHDAMSGASGSEMRIVFDEDQANDSHSNDFEQSYPLLEKYIRKLCRNNSKALNLSEQLKLENSSPDSFSPSKLPGPPPQSIEDSSDQGKITSPDNRSPYSSDLRISSPSDFSPCSSIGAAWHELDIIDKFVSACLKSNGMGYIQNRSTEILREMERLETYLIIASSLPPI